MIFFCRKKSSKGKESFPPSARVSSVSARVRMVKGLPGNDRLDGASNYGSWKPRVLLYLEEK